MLIVSGVRDLQVAARIGLDEVWAIVRSYKSPITIPGVPVYHVPELSPSPALFRTYLTMQKQGTWNDNAFHQIYVPTFLNEMLQEPAKNKLNLLWKKAREGKNIAIACFCPEARCCHRSIIAGLERGVGIKTIDPFGVEVDYSVYYQQYAAMKR